MTPLKVNKFWKRYQRERLKSIGMTQKKLEALVQSDAEDNMILTKTPTAHSCGKTGKHLTCQRPAGHTGKHEAYDYGIEEILGRWS
jgi:hypothetical protein